MQSYWEDNYAPISEDGKEMGKFYQKMLYNLEKFGGDYDWKAYLKTVKLWITETNCNADFDADEIAGTPAGEQCLRITGQRPKTHGIGSVQTL